MIAAQVTGRIWAERELPSLGGHRLVTARTAAGETIVAVDLIDVAAGNLVLLATDEAAQAAVPGDGAGIDAVVVALVAGADRLAELLTPAGATVAGATVAGATAEGAIAEETR